MWDERLPGSDLRLQLQLTCSSSLRGAEDHQNPPMRSREKGVAGEEGERALRMRVCIYLHKCRATDSCMINCGICFQDSCGLYICTIFRCALVMAWLA